MFNEIMKDTIVQSRLEWDNIERENIKHEVEQIVSPLRPQRSLERRPREA